MEPTAGSVRLIGMPHRRRIAGLLMIAIASIGPAGCAQGRTSAPGGAPADSLSASSPACGSDRSPGTRSITDADSGTTICVAVGDQIEVYLHGSPDAMWSPVVLDGTALSRTANGKGALPIGVTGAFFRANAMGSARLTSSRPPCVGGASYTTSCSPTSFVVAVVVG